MRGHCSNLVLPDGPRWVGMIPSRCTLRVSTHDQILEVRTDVFEGFVEHVLQAFFTRKAPWSTASHNQRASSAPPSLRPDVNISKTSCGSRRVPVAGRSSHLDTVFVRDRRNPLLATVDDVVAETLRILIREVSICLEWCVH